jgi:hypothetical protein
MLITLPQVRDGQITVRRLRQSFSWGETRYIGNTDRRASAHHKDIRWVRRRWELNRIGVSPVSVMGGGSPNARTPRRLSCVL